MAIEVKAPNGKPSELQKMNIRKINQCGGYGVVLYPDQFDDFKSMVELLDIDPIRAFDVANQINERWDK